MIFTATPIAGVWIVELEPITDRRGFFARAFSADEFRARGLNPAVAQVSVSHSRARGTLRGLHYQHPPAAEAKLVRAIRGAIFDVVVDLRKESPTYLQHATAELTADNRRAMYVAEGCAQGFQTLEDDSDVLYHISFPYTPELADGVRYDDPAIGIRWPLPVSVISARDEAWPLLVAPPGGPPAVAC